MVAFLGLLLKMMFLKAREEHGDLPAIFIGKEHS